MTDNKNEILTEAEDALFEIEKAYQTALDGNKLMTMQKLSPELDKARAAVADARAKLFASAVVVTDADLQEMKQIKNEIGQAAATQQIIQGAIQMVGLLAKFV